MNEAIHSDGAPKAVGPYSQAVRCGDLLFVAGQTPLDPASGAMVAGDVQAQARRVMESIKAIVQAAGLTVGHVVKCTCFLKDMNDFAAFNAVYAEYFGAAAGGAPLPARETVQVARLPKDALVEVSAICHA